MDLNDLKLEVDGETRTFAEWTSDFVDSFYPDVGRECYRVPALHFNQQTLSRSSSSAGAESHTVLLPPDPSTAAGDLAHTIVLERLEDLGHHLRASGQGPFFIISSVNYDNYLAKLQNARPKGRSPRPGGPKAEPQPAHLKPEQDARQHVCPKTESQQSLSEAKVEHSLSGSAARHSFPEAVLQHCIPDAEVRHSSRDEGLKRSLPDAERQHSPPDTGHQHVLQQPDPKSATAEQTGSVSLQPSEGVTVEEEGKQLLPPRPSDRGSQRGEIDILLLHRKGGVVLIEVKATGRSRGSWTPSEEELHVALQSRVDRASRQLENSRDTLHYIMPDVRLPEVTLVLALPYVTRPQLTQAVSGQSVDPNLRFLCKDDLWPFVSEGPTTKSPGGEGKEDISPQDAGISGLLAWWQTTMYAGVREHLPLDSMKTIVGRICGLLSVVSVWTTNKPRVEVRTLPQATEESGRRLTHVVLLPRQAELLAQPCLPHLWLTGPLGSGKTLLLQLKGRQWLREGRRVIVINVRKASRGRPHGYVLEEGIRRTLENPHSGAGSVERHDIALDEFQFKIFQAKLDEGGPMENACFVVDEVLSDMSIIAQTLIEHYPDSPIWCVASYVTQIPDMFQCVTLEEVLRNPPSVQLMLKELDLNPRHKYAYTIRSALRGLPCDGPPVIFIDHSKHNTHVRKLDCEQCANELADILEHKLGLKLRPSTFDSPKQDHLTTKVAEPLSHSSSLNPSFKKSPKTVEAASLTFRDVLIIVVLPMNAFRHVNDYHWEASIPEVLQFILYMGSSHFVSCLRQRGVPLKIATDNTLKEIAFPPNDEVVMSEVMGAHSLERKVIVLLRSGPSLSQEEVTEHISRYKTFQTASSCHQTDPSSILQLLKTPLDSATVSKQLNFFVSLMYEVSDIAYPQLTTAPLPSPGDSKGIFYHLLGNMLVSGTQSFTRDKLGEEGVHQQQTQPTAQSSPCSVELRRGMEYRGDLVQMKTKQDEGREAANTVLFVPGIQEDVEQRQDEVKRIQKAMESLSDDDLDWEFFAASRCLSQYISILP